MLKMWCGADDRATTAANRRNVSGEDSRLPEVRKPNEADYRGEHFHAVGYARQPNDASRACHCVRMPMSRRQRYKQEQARQDAQPVTEGECLVAELLGLYHQYDDLEPLAAGNDLSAAAARLRLRCLKEDIRVARRKIAQLVPVVKK